MGNAGGNRSIADIKCKLRASREQSQSVQQITAAVTQMDKVVQPNAASAEESASAAEELNAQSFALREAIGELLGLVGTQDSAAIGGQTESRAIDTPRARHGRPTGIPRSNGATIGKKAMAFSTSESVHGSNGHGG